MNGYESAKMAQGAYGVTRRSFLTGAGAAVAAATLGMAGCAPSTETKAADSAAGDETLANTGETTSARMNAIADELGYPGEEAAPSETSYECDILVVGAGWAGLHAAVRSARAGAKVICVDKGKPGYSGLAPFSNSTTWFDEDFDDFEGSVNHDQMTGEYIANLDYLRMYINATPDAWALNDELGICEQYNSGIADGYEHNEEYDYFEQYRDTSSRHAKWLPALEDNGVQVLTHTMLTDVVTEDGRVTGAIGFQFRSSTVVSISAKAVILCTGPSSIRSAGYPTSGNTFDGEYIAYNLGLTILGKEFDDFHQTNSWAAGDTSYNCLWDYVQPINPVAIFNCVNDKEVIDNYVIGKGNFMIRSRVNQALEGVAACDGTGLKGDHSPEPAEGDPRYTDYLTNTQELTPETKADVYGIAAGMNAHMCGGVYCGWDDMDGKTSVPGLYVAGDGTYGAMFLGAMYSLGCTTSTGCSVMGDRSAAAAVEYIKDVEQVPVSQEKIDAATEEIFAPSKLEKGFDPNWARDILNATMIAPQVHLARTEETLSAALNQVEWLRDRVVPKLMGYSGHDLRLCMEMKHKVLASELKLRVQMARKESRGMHYRIDFPYRDDDNFLCYMGVRKGDDGNPVVEKVEIPDSWKGDTSLAYTDRYLWRFPGEEDALGLPKEEKGGR